MNIIIMNIFQYTRDLNFKIIIFIYYYYERINSNKIWTLKIKNLIVVFIAMILWVCLLANKFDIQFFYTDIIYDH